MTQAEENMHDTEESDFHAQISCQNRLSFNKKSNVMNIHHLEMLHEKKENLSTHCIVVLYSYYFFFVYLFVFSFSQINHHDVSHVLLCAFYKFTSTRYRYMHGSAVD